VRNHAAPSIPSTPPYNPVPGGPVLPPTAQFARSVPIFNTKREFQRALSVREAISHVISMIVVVPWFLAALFTVGWLANADQVPSGLLVIVFLAVGFGVPAVLMYWVRRAFYKYFGVPCPQCNCVLRFYSWRRWRILLDTATCPRCSHSMICEAT